MKKLLVYTSLLLFILSCVKKEKIKHIISEPVITLHDATGLVESEGLNLVIANCTSCHSAKLITQNRASREGWEATIRWMQDTQNLWPLGENEPLILDYLTRNYAPENTGRRKPLTDIVWYELNTN